SASVVPEAEVVSGDGMALPPHAVTDERETRLSVSEGAHRRTGFPSDGKPENRESRRPGNPPLRKTEQHERTSPRKNEQQQAGPASCASVGGAVPLRAVIGDAAVALKEGSGG